MNAQRCIRQLSYGLLFLGLAWFIAPANGFACERPKERTWLQLLATMPDPCEIGFSTTDASSDMSSSRRQQVAKSGQAVMFAAASMESLSQDMARGEGEYLTSLATLLEVPADRQAAFFQLAQEHYPLSAQDGRSSPADMIRGLQLAMAAHPAFAQAVALR